MSTTDIPQRPTPAQLYDFVVERITEQGRPSVDCLARACVYRGANGAKCAVGHIIADEHYSPDLEGTAFLRGDGYRPLLRAVTQSLGFEELPQEHVRLLRAMQVAHDTAADDEEDIAAQRFVNRFRARLPPRPSEQPCPAQTSPSDRPSASSTTSS